MWLLFFEFFKIAWNFPKFSKKFFLPLSRQTNDKFGNFSVFQIFKAFSSYFLTLVFFSLYFSSKSSKFWFKMLICKEKNRKINGLGSLFSKWTGLLIFSKWTGLYWICQILGKEKLSFGFRGRKSSEKTEMISVKFENWQEMSKWTGLFE